MEAALYGARLMNVFERSSPLVAMTAESDLVNGWPGGIIQASGPRLFVTPLYHVNQLYNGHRGRDRLKVTVEGPTFDTSKEGTGVPVLDAVASRSADGSELYVKVVNTSPTSAVDTADRPPRRGRRVRKRSGTCSRRRAWRRTTASPRRTRFALVATTCRRAAASGVSLPPRSVSVIVLRVTGSRKLQPWRPPSAALAPVTPGAVGGGLEAVDRGHVASELSVSSWFTSRSKIAMASS